MTGFNKVPPVLKPLRRGSFGGWQQKYVDAGLFVEVARPVYFNLCAVSGIADPNDPKKPFLGGA